MNREEIIEAILHNKTYINDVDSKTLDDAKECLENGVREFICDNDWEYLPDFATGILKYQDKYFKVEFRIMWFNRDEIDSITVKKCEEIILTDNLKLEFVEVWCSYDNYYKKELSLDKDSKLLLSEFTGIDFNKFVAECNDNIVSINCDELSNEDIEIIINGFKFKKIRG